MNAEEMFKKLGYEKVKFGRLGNFSYERFSDDKYFIFDLNSKEIYVCEDCITVEELRAINKQCEELGWKNV